MTIGLQIPYEEVESTIVYDHITFRGQRKYIAFSVPGMDYS